MINRIALSLVVVVVVALACVLAGLILGALGGAAPVLLVVAAFLEKFCWLLGLLAGAWFFFSGRTSLRL